MINDSETGPLQYSGGKTNEHFPFNSTTSYGQDNSGTVTYNFNSTGYRGEEFNEHADFKIFVCGASSGFATGVQDQDTWWFQLKCMYAEKLGLQPENVSLFNASAGGASYDHISRVFLSQAPRLRPDLVVIAPGDMKGVEYLTKNVPILKDRGLCLYRGILRYLPNSNRPLPAMPRAFPFSSAEWKELLNIAQKFYQFDTREMDFANLIKNLLLVQFYCQIHRIRHITWHLYQDSMEKLLGNNEWPGTVLKLLEQLDLKKIISIPQHDFDKGADGRHPGPEANRYIAQVIFEHLSRSD